MVSFLACLLASYLSRPVMHLGFIVQVLAAFPESTYVPKSRKVDVETSQMECRMLSIEEIRCVTGKQSNEMMMNQNTCSDLS